MSPCPDPPRTDEPLTPEERAWAQQLARIGPHDGPPPALDAKILAAAHAAVAGRGPVAKPRRWPAYVGVAASLVVAVGLAWQLRPLWQVRPPLSEAASAAAPLPPDEGTLSADVLAAAEPVARERVASPPPPSKPPLRARQLKAPATVVAAPAAPPAPAPPPPPPHFQDEAIGDEPVPMAAPATAVASDAGSAAQASVAAAAAADAASRAKSSERRERAAMAAPSAVPAERATGPASSAAMPAYAPAAAAPRQDTGANAAREAMAPPGSTQAEPALDRIEVTGSRIRVADLPVRDDTRLAPAEWLERIRERRNADDLDGARASLRLFRQQHPRLRVPSDLLPLGR